MEKSVLKIDRDYVIGKVEDRVYSSFVEHMGSCIYNGIYEPGHPTADSRGFRQDVLTLAKRMQLPALRYPGGNFCSGYNWEDSVGPNRPVRLDFAWKQTEPNTFGLHEFFEWLKEVNSQIIMSVNLGTRGADAARNLLEYTNHPGGTYYSDMRIANGRKEPFAIKTWCLGNELDGIWQIGHKTPEEYGRLASETARLMRAFDPSLELIAVGSSNTMLPTYPEWDRKVLMACYEDVDYIALHKYVNHNNRDTAGYLAASLDMEQNIKTIIAACDYVQTAKRSNKTMMLAVDEWNTSGWPKEEKIPKENWQIGPNRATKTYTHEDALAFGSLLMTLIRHADRVKIACQAILVNVLPTIVTEKGGAACASTIYYPLLHGSLYGRGISMHCQMKTPLYDSAEYQDVPTLDSAAVLSEDESTLTVFCVNRGQAAQELNIVLGGLGPFSQCEHIFMAEPLEAKNTLEQPENCVPKSRHFSLPKDGDLQMALEGYSWNVLRLQK